MVKKGPIRVKSACLDLWSRYHLDLALINRIHKYWDKVRKGEWWESNSHNSVESKSKIKDKMRITAVSYPPLLAFLFIVPVLSQGEAYPT